MGMRSQIYIRYKNKKGTQLIARYFQWNYGENMVSRARSIIEWLTYMHEYRDWLFDNERKMLELERVCDVNFDMRSISLSTDIVREVVEQKFDESCGLNNAIFGQDNNNGQLLIDATSVTIKYAFIPYFLEPEKIMDAYGYMDWDLPIGWRDNQYFAEYTNRNIQYIAEHAELMTEEDVRNFLGDDYEIAAYGAPF